jgi:hypothetical protein
MKVVNLRDTNINLARIMNHLHRGGPVTLKLMESAQDENTRRSCEAWLERMGIEK